MALRQAGLISRAEGGSSLVITPRAGEAFRVRRIFCVNVTGSPAFLLVVNDTARVGFFRVAGYGGNHLTNPRSMEVANNVRGGNILDWLIAYENFAGYPVVQGESLTLSVNTGTADFFAIYDSYDAADVKSSEQNGSKSSDIVFVNYGTNLAAITTAAYTKLALSQNPAEMPAFPFGAPNAGLVPAGKKAHIYVIGGQAVARFVSGGNTAASVYLRMRVGTAPAQTILDRNDVGIQFIGTIPGAGVDYTATRSDIPSILWGDALLYQVLPELDFNPNDEFSIQVQAVITGTGQLNASDMDVWCLMRIYPAS